MKFRFNVKAGPATYPSSGTGLVSLSKPPTWNGFHYDLAKDDDDEPITTRVRPWAPNMEPDTLLKCGCSIPWPIVVLLGSHGQQVSCDQHGFQRVVDTERARARKATKKWVSTAQQTLPDEPPF